MIHGYISENDLTATWKKEFKYNPSAVQPHRFNGSIKIYDDEKGRLYFSRSDALNIVYEEIPTEKCVHSSDIGNNHTLWKFFLDKNTKCIKIVEAGGL